MRKENFRNFTFHKEITRRQISDLSQNESIFRRQNKRYKRIEFVLSLVESCSEKKESAAFQHFLLCPQCFQKASF